MFNFSNNQCKTPHIYNNQNSSEADFDTLQKARHDLIGEIHAIIEYDEHLHTTSNEIAKQTWKDIIDEEITHVGQLLGLINYLDPTQRQFFEKGYTEFMKSLK